jgi:hypothetical protein
MDDLLSRALKASRESKLVEFKESFDVGSPGDWCEFIKDIVALANTGGGVILVGVDNHGKSNGFDVTSILRFDPADLTNKIHKYTGLQFSDFEISEREKGNRKLAAFRVEGVPIPIVFTKPGTYDIGGGKQRNAFSAGTVYFRHGAKSEPGNTEDIRRVIERQLESIRKEWIRGVRKVVAPPRGSQVLVVQRQTSASSSRDATRIRIVDDPSAPAVRLTRDTTEATGVFLHEELSDGLFDEINNVLNANTLLARGLEKFLLGTQVYFRIYAERHHIEAPTNHIRLLALTGLQDIYGPVLYWLLHLPIADFVSILRPMCENPKAPNVYSIIRIMILLGPQASNWLYELWTKKWPGRGQHPDFYWRMKEVASRNEGSDRRLLAIRTMSGISQEVSDGDQKHSINDLWVQPKLASSYLSKACVKVFEGDKEARSLCRQLDILAYGQQIESKSQEIVDALI